MDEIDSTSGTSDTATADARPWQRPRSAHRKAWVTGVAALTVALAGAGVAFATIGGGTNQQACEKAIRGIVAQAAAGKDMRDAGKPKACRGFSDAQTEEMGTRLMGEQFGALFAGLSAAFNAGTTDSTSTPVEPVKDQQEACADALRPLVAKLHRMPAVAPGPCYDLHGEDYNAVARDVMTS